ncbi:MAG: integrin alpha, partial [Mangrovicoccus sp.]|nr:integrin alpha [Mangrovicoccus sp.]
AYGADPAGAENAGKAYVVFGQKDGFDSSLDLARLDGSNGFALTGEAAGDYAGRSVSNAGDVNGDGLDDLIIGAYWADVDGNAKAGKAYVVFGKAGGFDATLALGSLDGSDGFALTGLSANNNTGTSVSSAGDVNGDGLDDILVSAPNAQAYRGDTYLIYGKAGGFDASLSLADLDGGNGLRLTGVDHYDYSGISASGAGDLNGDGYSDVIIGANVADPNGLSAAGESYVLFGGPDGLLMPPSSGPSIDPLPENLRIPELVPFELTLSASDPNGNDTISINADLIRPNGTLANPKWYQFTDNGDGTGTINWRVPERYKDVTYTVVVTADDGENPAVVDSFLIDVFDTNAPVFADLEDAMVEERSNISFDVMASDRDGDDTISLSATLLRPNGRLAKPERYEFTDLGDGTGHFTWDTPSRSEDGAYTLRITAEDGLNRPVHREMTITVLEIDDMILM